MKISLQYTLMYDNTHREKRKSTNKTKETGILLCVEKGGGFPVTIGYCTTNHSAVTDTIRLLLQTVCKEFVHAKQTSCLLCYHGDHLVSKLNLYHCLWVLF